MAHPKHRKSKSRTLQGRAHHSLKPASLTECPNCRSWKMPHRVCPSCGFYKNATVV